MIDIRITRRAALAGLAATPFIPALAHAGTLGSITRLDPALDAILDVNAPIEVLCTGIKWAEGPVWVKKGGYLLFSDVPSNIMYKWSAKEGKTVFMDPSGLIGAIPPAIREAGSNGLAINAAGMLVMADSGSRGIALVDLKTKAKHFVAQEFEGKRFNSCNDVSIHGNGTIYFTDPPYGLAEGDTSPLKQLAFNGVFRLDPEGKVNLIDDKLTRPNGIGVSPDQQILYVSQSDPAKPVILAYPLDIEGGVSDYPKVFQDFSAEVAQNLPGLPDGLKVAKSGNLFASGPGGIYILSPAGKRLGLISTGKAAANCNFGEDGKSLFITTSDMVVRVRLKQSGW